MTHDFVWSGTRARDARCSRCGLPARITSWNPITFHFFGGHDCPGRWVIDVLGPATASPAVAPVAFHQPPRDLSRVAVRTCPISGLESHR